MESSNIIQTSTRKRKLSQYLTRDDEQYYVPKRKQSGSSHSPKRSSRKAESKSAPSGSASSSSSTSTLEDTAAFEALKREKESIETLCEELTETNKNLEGTNTQLQEQLKMQEEALAKIAAQEIEEESQIDWDKYPVGVLSVEELADLWNEMCSIPISSCKCNAKVNCVAKKRVTQLSTRPVISL